MRTNIIHADDLAELEDALKKARINDFEPTVGFVFSSPTFDLEAIYTLFDQENIDLFGCSTAGEIMNQEVLEASIVVSLVDLKKENYKIVTSDAIGGDIYEAAFEIGNHAKAAFKNPALLVVTAGVTIDGEKVLLNIKKGIGREIPVFGGMAGDELKFETTQVFSRKGVLTNGLVVMILDNDKVEVNGMATSGWEAIGAVNTITKAVDNVVYTINDEPALDVFVRYFGYFDNAALDGKAINTMSAQYPMQIIRDGGYSVLRSPVVSDEVEKTLVLAGGVKQGDKFRFSISPGFEVIDKTIDDFGKLNKTHPDADLMILFSCKGRHAALGPMIEDEIEGICNYWDAPLVGFFAYGEIGNTPNGICDFHNETCSLVVLNEK